MIFLLLWIERIHLIFFISGYSSGFTQYDPIPLLLLSLDHFAPISREAQKQGSQSLLVRKQLSRVIPLHLRIWIWAESIEGNTAFRIGPFLMNPGRELYGSNLSNTYSKSHILLSSPQ